MENKNEGKIELTGIPVKNLTYENFKPHIKEIIDFTNEIVSKFEIGINQLSKLTGLHYYTVKKVLRGEKSIYKIYAKLNNFNRNVRDGAMKLKETEVIDDDDDWDPWVDSLRDTN